jgi:hypothetical protein
MLLLISAVMRVHVFPVVCSEERFQNEYIPPVQKFTSFLQSEIFLMKARNFPGG